MMKNTKLVLTLLFVTFLSIGNAQQKKVTIDESLKKGEATKSETFTAECVGYRNVPTSDLKWRPILTNKKIAYEHEGQNSKKLEAIKAAKLKLKMQNINSGGTVEVKSNKSSVTPVVGNNFLGNTNNGTSPLDNSIAISDGGWIVSVANSTIEYDDMNGNNSYFTDLASFVNDPGITNICDPVVIYDPGADRFILFAQECSGNSSNSFLLVFFSQTNNPNDGWNYYKLTGNPLNDNSAFDYPKLAISNNECYISGNLYANGNYNQSLLYQINKNSGYSGGELQWQYWYNIDGNPFTLCPVSFGQGDTYGPGVYMVATGSGGGSTIKFYDLTNDIGQNPSFNYFEINTTSYSPAANCPQLGSSCNLNNGDCRALSGFYLDGKVHFVFHSDVGNGWNGINYNRLDLNTGVNTSSTFGIPGTVDYTYPSVVSFANSPTDHSVMIGFGAVSSNIYPEVRVVNCDNNMNWSTSTLVKAGESYSCYTNPNQERWGDYTGTTRKHNSQSPSIWMNGMYGTTNNNWNTWISEIHAGAGNSIDEPINTNTSLNVYPNPVVETFKVEFASRERENIIIDIVNLNGKIIKELYRGKSTVGINMFSFNKANLSIGTYVLRIKSNNQIISHEKIIITD